jgi:7-cyano-7-deazaguanine synthase
MTGTAVIVLSGGVDSTVALAHYAYYGYRPLAVSINYGQRHQRELAAAARIAQFYDAEHIVADLSALGGLLTSALTDRAIGVPAEQGTAPASAVIVPNRNAILANVAAGVAVARSAEVVVLGMHAGDHHVFPDCRPEFVTQLDRLVRVANEGAAPMVRVEAPFMDWGKARVVRRGLELGVPLDLTWSCYRGGAEHCGTCAACAGRAEAFRQAGALDPTVYEADSPTVVGR